jgi:thiosulfate sulfurtransferase
MQRAGSYNSSDQLGGAMYKQITHLELDTLRANQDVAIVDVRDEESFYQAHIPRAVHLTMDGFQEFISSADRNKPTIVYCYHGVTSQSVAQLLVESGFDCIYSLLGGFESWQNDHSRSES